MKTTNKNQSPIRRHARSVLLAGSFASVGILAMVACATESGDTDGAQGSQGVSGAMGFGGGSSFGGSPAGVGGSPVGVGGSPVGVGGTPPAVGGVSGAGGSVAGSAGTTAAGGAGGMATTCVPVSADGTAPTIDDLEDGDHQILKNEGRVGYWYTYNDMTGTQTPAGATFLPEAGAAHTTGTGFTGFGAGLGLDLFNAGGKSCAYNAGVYTGVSFTLTSNVTLRFRVTTPELTPTADGGTCATECSNMHGVNIEATAGAATPMMIPFSMLAQDPSWGTMSTPTPNPASIIQLQWQVVSTSDTGMGIPDFDFTVDNVSFY